MNDVQKPLKRRETKSYRNKSGLLRPETLRTAFAVVRLIQQVAKLIDWFQR